MDRRCGRCLWESKNKCCLNPPQLVKQGDVITWLQPEVEDSEWCSKFVHYKSEETE